MWILGQLLVCFLEIGQQGQRYMTPHQFQQAPHGVFVKLLEIMLDGLHVFRRAANKE